MVCYENTHSATLRKASGNTAAITNQVHAIGVASRTEVDFFNINLRKWGSGYILLCSDGLTNYLDNKILFELLFQSREKVRPTPQEELEKKVETLVSYANKSGGSDNITVLLARF